MLADRRPFVLDVDSGSVANVRGVAELNRGVLQVVPVGGRGAAIVARSAPDGRIYGLSAGHTAAADLGRGRNVAPDAVRDAVWIQSAVRGRRCTIRGTTLTGRPTLRTRAFPCAATFDAGGRAGVVVNRTAVYDPETGRVVLRTPAGVIAAAGTKMVLLGPRKNLALFDSETRRRHGLGWPSVLAGADDAAADPQGRFMALGFADPSWRGTGRQVLDVWLLDLRTRKLRQLPGMPALVDLKFTSMSWTDDGRLVFVARRAGRHVVAIWRPGRRHLSVANIRIRPRSGGSDSFAVIG